MSTDEPNRPSLVRVLIVDDQRLMRDGIASLLGLQPGIEIVGTAGNGQEALEQAQALLPDVVLMDVRMPVLDGVHATIQLRRQHPDCQVLMLTTFDNDEYITDALRAGACGYILKDIPAEDLAHAIHAAHRGIFQFDPAIGARVMATLSASPHPSSAPQTSHRPATASDLTSREIDVLRLISQGATNREIAAQLFLSEGTVRNQVSSILSRLGLRDRTQAALYARDAGLI